MKGQVINPIAAGQRDTHSATVCQYSRVHVDYVNRARSAAQSAGKCNKEYSRVYRHLLHAAQYFLNRLTGFQLRKKFTHILRNSITAFTKCPPPAPNLSQLDPAHAPRPHILIPENPS